MIVVGVLTAVLMPSFSGPAIGQTGPTLTHPAQMFWWKPPISAILVEAETQSRQYLRADVYVALDCPFPPANLGPLGTLLINPGALVHRQLAVTLTAGVPPSPAWLTIGAVTYPRLSQLLVGTRFRVQVLAYDATVPNRVVLSRNYVTVTIVE